MEQQNFSPIGGTNIDPDTFRRVWGRVMPDQTCSPLEVAPLEETAPPEDIITPPAELPSQPGPELPPSSPDAGEGLPPVPVCPAPSPEEPAPVPPAEGETPPAEDAPLCLGEHSQPYAQRLEELMTLAQEGIAAGQQLSRRASGSCAKALTALTADHRRAFRQLSAAYFLITGQRFRPACTAPALPASLPLALRAQFVWEQQWERACRQAAQATDDPCLEELYLELAQDGALHTGVIRSLLEQM